MTLQAKPIISEIKKTRKLLDKWAKIDKLE